MEVREQRLLAFGCFFVIAIVLIMPAYADIKSFKTDKTFYVKGDKITFSGTAEDEDVGQIVTVVVRDPADNFVLLRQAYIGVERNFEIQVDTKSDFSVHGTYNATAFFTNETAGVVIDFDFSPDGSPVIHPKTEPITETQPTQQPQVGQDNTNTEAKPDQKSGTSEDEMTIQEKIRERIEMAKKLKEAQANQPIQTGSGQIGINQTTGNQNTTTADSTITGDNSYTTGTSTVPVDLGSNLMYVVIGLGGAGAAAAVVYGVKNKAKHDSGSKPVVKVRELSDKVGVPSEEDYALMILKNRLAKGEITIDEFNALKKALQEP